MKEQIKKELKKQSNKLKQVNETDKLNKKSSKSKTNFKTNFKTNIQNIKGFIHKYPKQFKIAKYTVISLSLLTIGYRTASWQFSTRLDASSASLSKPFSLSYSDVTSDSVLSNSSDALSTTIANTMIKLDKDTKTKPSQYDKEYKKIKDNNDNVTEGQLTFKPTDYSTETGLKAIIYAGRHLNYQINNKSKINDIQKMIKSKELSNQEVGIVVINKSLYEKSTDIQSAININKKLVDENKFDDINADNSKIVKLNNLSLNDPAFFETFIYTTNGLMKKVQSAQKDKVIEFDTTVNNQKLHIIVRGLKDNTLSEKDNKFDKTTTSGAKSIVKAKYIKDLTSQIDKSDEYPAKFKMNVIKQLNTLVNE